ncbi:putative argininosuccinate lyase [Termitomyces sp. J132]|nr:putative argininosuccinate lyase [Termitomyces sp. J132]
MADQPTKQKLWGGRFTGKTDPLMHAFNQSLRYDQRMYAVDIKGSIAYAKSLSRVGILTPEEEATIASGLRLVLKEWQDGTFQVQPDDEDIHTANERRLSELIGPLGGKLHTGRSRNDQVATDMRLWLLEEAADIEVGLKSLIRVMVERADKEKDLILPGYTHLQRGQPIRWSHLLLSHAFSFSSDLQRLRQLIPRISVSPLGCGALAGNPFVVDREFLAEELGFQTVAENSLWGVGDRDFIVEFLMWSSLAMTHVSRMAEDLVIYSTAEFGFVTLSDAYSTGSSIMPQKKNPDSLELLRGKSGRVFGNVCWFLMTLKGLPSTYNKDLQEDKEPLFDAVDTVAASFQIAEGVIATLEVHAEKMRQALTMDVLATDLADYLVKKGVRDLVSFAIIFVIYLFDQIPFRETHHISGQAVALAESRKCQLNDLTLKDYRGLNENFTDDIRDVFDFEASVERRESIGGTSRKMIDRQVAVLRNILDEQ